MEKFRDVEHYNEVIESFDKSHENVVGNITKFKKEIEKVISEDRLFYSLYPHTLLIFRDELDYWQVMLKTDGQYEEIKLSDGKPYASVISTSLRKGNAKERLHEKLTSLGINLVASYSSCMIDLSKSYSIAKSIVDDWTDNMKEKGYEFLPFNEKYIDDIHELWSKHLHRYNYPKEQWNFDIDTNNVFLLFDMKLYVPKLVAMVCVFKKDATYLSTGLVVHPDYRRDMLAMYIDAVEFSKAYEDGIKILYSWVMDGNKRAVKLLEMFGGKLLPLGCQQYYSG